MALPQMLRRAVQHLAMTHFIV